MAFWWRKKHSRSEQGRYAAYAQELEPLKQQLGDLMKIARSRPAERAELAPIERSIETLNKRMLGIWHEVQRLQQQEERVHLSRQAQREEKVRPRPADVRVADVNFDQSPLSIQQKGQARRHPK